MRHVVKETTIEVKVSVAMATPVENFRSFGVIAFLSGASSSAAAFLLFLRLELLINSTPPRSFHWRQDSGSMSSALSCCVLETASAACVVGVGCVNARKANAGKDPDVGHCLARFVLHGDWMLLRWRVLSLVSCLVWSTSVCCIAMCWWHRLCTLPSFLPSSWVDPPFDLVERKYLNWWTITYDATRHDGGRSSFSDWWSWSVGRSRWSKQMLFRRWWERRYLSSCCRYCWGLWSSRPWSLAALCRGSSRVALPCLVRSGEISSVPVVLPEAMLLTA